MSFSVDTDPQSLATAELPTSPLLLAMNDAPMTDGTLTLADLASGFYSEAKAEEQATELATANRPKPEPTYLPRTHTLRTPRGRHRNRRRRVSTKRWLVIAMVVIATAAMVAGTGGSSHPSRPEPLSFVAHLRVPPASTAPRLPRLQPLPTKTIPAPTTVVQKPPANRLSHRASSRSVMARQPATPHAQRTASTPAIQRPAATKPVSKPKPTAIRPAPKPTHSTETPHPVTTPTPAAPVAAPVNVDACDPVNETCS